MEDPTNQHWGYDLGKRVGIRSGVLYPILRRMLEEGWLSDGWEDTPARGRPPRRYYELTAEGVAHFSAELRAARADARFSSILRPA